MSTLEIPDWMKERMDKRQARADLNEELAVMLESEASKNDADGYIDVTIGRASQLLRMPISKIGEHLGKPVTRQRMQNYKVRDCHARVYIDSRKVEIRSKDGEKLNQGVMP